MYMTFINYMDWSNGFSFIGHPSTSKFLGKSTPGRTTQRQILPGELLPQENHLVVIFLWTFFLFL